MCGPVVMAAVRAEMNRRGLFGAAGATVLAGAVGGRSVSAARQGATPVSGSSGTTGGTTTIAQFSSIVDLSHTITPDFPLFPGGTPFELTSLQTFEADGYYGNRIAVDEHTATHMDAPAHFDPDGLTADRLPVAGFVAPLAVIDISGRAANDSDAQVLPDDILEWEAVNGSLPPGAFVAMFSAWESRLSDPTTYLNEGADGGFHYPGFHPDTAVLLVAERDIVGIGVDTLSLDYGQSADFQTHLTVLPAGKYGIENLANLGDLPAAGATVIVGGPKHLNASGGPARIFALV
jgi:kynurenine formamidase